jgi:hypothetical protein
MKTMGEAAVKLAEEPGDLKGLLRKAAKPEEPVKKGSTPILPVEESIRILATEVKKEKELADSHKSVFEQKSLELVNAISAMRAELCRHAYQSAVRIPTMDNLSLTIVWSGNYTKIPGSREADLINIVGDQYPDYFKSRFALAVKSDLSNAELNELVQLLGEERFIKWFESEEVIRPTERFIHDHVRMDAQTREALELADVKQYKAAVKTR